MPKIYTTSELDVLQFSLISLVSITLAAVRSSHQHNLLSQSSMWDSLNERLLAEWSCSSSVGSRSVSSILEIDEGMTGLAIDGHLYSSVDVVEVSNVYIIVQS